MVRAKFVCYSVEESTFEGSKTEERIHLTAVYGVDGSANAEWSKWTPSGDIKMTISNPGAFGQFVQGVEYFIDFTPVDG